ncbi:integrin alpha pat-2-like [Macrobrachium rosenbergii]|uniref:integrin alpha pat-2-like n=1 Tax=Macrobrachium rosenbergii TaxID=79674 RepID=UPI0034D4F281
MIMKVTVFVLGMSLLQHALTFNIDIKSSVSVTGPAGSNFGFSVAMWWRDGMSRLVIGAPGYSASGGNWLQHHPIQEGAVFLCNFTEDMSYESCNLLSRNFDVTDAQDMTRNLEEFGFGSTVVAGGRNNTSLLVCAPQSYNVFKRGQFHSYKTLGECVLLDSSSSSGVRIKPNEGGQEYIDDFVYCGFSASFSKDNTAVFMSCPSISLDSSKFKIITYNITTRRVQQFDLTDICDGNYYKGWHVAPVSHEDGIVASCVGTGQVNAKVIKTDGSPHSSQSLDVAGLTVGERAGFSLETCDVDGDGEDEVVVGAPFGRVHREYASSLWMETGKIVVLGNRGKHSTYDGPQEFNRFGSSIACLGDLNKDGYQDIAVGAPQHSKGGAVFIYSGSREGLRQQPSQVIHGTDVKPHMVGFGYSLASGHDLDGNGYPDLLVGSPQSNAVVSLRTAPVIKIGVHSFRFSEEQVDLQRPDHTLHLIVEVDYHSERNFVVEMDWILNLDVNQRWGKRILFEENSQASLKRRIKLENVGINNFSFPVYIEISSSEDVVDVSYSDLKMSFIEVRSLTGETIAPVLEDLENPGTQWKDLVRTTSVRLSCSSNITSCIATTNIMIETKTQRMPFDVGLRDVELTIDLTVENATAFDPTLTLMTPQGLVLRRAYFTNTLIDLSCQSDSSCLASSEACLPVQVCTSSRTKLRPADEASIALLFKQKREEVISFTNNHPDPQMNFSVTVGSVNEDFDESDNTLSLTFLPQVSPDFYILGLSAPETLSVEASSSTGDDGVNMTRVQDVFLASDHLNKSDFGPTVKHSYDLTERGDIPLEEIQVDMYWPTRNGTDNRTISLLKTSPKVFPSAAGMCQYNGTFWDHSTFLDNSSFVYAIFSCTVRPGSQKGKITLTTEAVLVKSYFMNAPSSVSLRSQITGRIVSPTSWHFSSSLDKQESEEVMRTLAVLTKVSVIHERGNQLPAPWIIILSVLSGLALLGILVYGMYKVGFFKRRLVPRFQKHEEAIETNNEDSLSNGN